MRQTYINNVLQSSGPRLLDKKQGEARYGGTPAWWNKAVYKKLIPYTKRGAKVCFFEEDLEAYFLARRVPAAQEAA